MSSELEHAYQLLEVSPDVTDKEMRSAWRRLERR
jgi:curved DNA-binding protein CbpA